MKEKASRLNVFSMNFRKEVELEHGAEIIKKCILNIKYDIKYIYNNI
jgi:hypothetical protein